jgi:hypothetical protein
VTLIGVGFYILNDRFRHPCRFGFGSIPSDYVDVRFDLADRDHLLDAGQRHQLVGGHDDLLRAPLAGVSRGRRRKASVVRLAWGCAPDSCSAFVAPLVAAIIVISDRRADKNAGDYAAYLF